MRVSLLSLLASLLVHSIALSLSHRPVIHQLSAQDSDELSQGIKIVIIRHIHRISNETAAVLILRDIFAEKDSQRQLHEITPTTAGQFFDIFALKRVDCDRDRNGWVRGPQLKCLNKIWKYFIPNDRLFQ